MKILFALMLTTALMLLLVGLVLESGSNAAAGAEKKDNGLLESKDEILAAYKNRVAQVISVLSDKKIRESDRPTTIAAIELAGQLRAKEAVSHLVDLLLYGKKGPIEDLRRVRRKPEPPDLRAPAVQALINIGMPSLEAVCQKLVSTSKPIENRDTLRRHCVWVIWKVLGTDLGAEYMRLAQKRHPEAKEVFDDVRGFFETRSAMEKSKKPTGQPN